jgi:hypothetical protein
MMKDQSKEPISRLEKENQELVAQKAKIQDEQAKIQIEKAKIQAERLKAKKIDEPPKINRIFTPPGY